MKMMYRKNRRTEILLDRIAKQMKVDVVIEEEEEEDIL